MFGKKFRIEELFENEKLCKRTVEGKEFYLASKVVNIPEVGVGDKRFLVLVAVFLFFGNLRSYSCFQTSQA